MSTRLTDSKLLIIFFIIPPLVFMIIMIFTSLLPQLKLRLSAKADRKRALRSLKKSIKNSSSVKSYDFLNYFNKSLEEFLKRHGEKDDEVRLKKPMKLIHEVLYGRASISIEDAIISAYNVIESLEAREAADE